MNFINKELTKIDPTIMQIIIGGSGEIRTHVHEGSHRFAGGGLRPLGYASTFTLASRSRAHIWWASQGSNLDSSGYEPAALASYAKGPNKNNRQS